MYAGSHLPLPLAMCLVHDMPQRWKLLIEYDGSGFVGWQRQDAGFSVQGALEEAIFKLSGEKVSLHVAGRTDSGVHALGQVAHFDLEKTFEVREVRNAINVHVRPHAVSVLNAEPVGEGFHARFNARKRHYRYVICNRPSPPAINAKYMWYVPQPLNIEHMQEAANHLLGHHDFTSFRAIECQAKSPVRTLDQLDITREGDHVTITTSAQSFLHHQVRNIVGTLAKIGRGRWVPEKAAEILAARDRTVAGPTAPSCGLFFVCVDYSDNGSK